METQLTTGLSAAVPTLGPTVISRPAKGGAGGGSDLKNVQAAVNQFRTASMLMTTQITRLSIEMYGANAAAQTLSTTLLSLNATTLLATTSTAAFDSSLVGLKASTDSTQAAVTSLDQTLQQMQGINILSESLGQLNAGATQTQETIDNVMLPAFDRAYAGFFDLANAATGFGRTAGDILRILVDTARDALIRIVQYSANALSGGPSGGGQGGPKKPPEPNNAMFGTAAAGPGGMWTGMYGGALQEAQNFQKGLDNFRTTWVPSFGKVIDENIVAPIFNDVGLVGRYGAALTGMDDGATQGRRNEQVNAARSRLAYAPVLTSTELEAAAREQRRAQAVALRDMRAAYDTMQELAPKQNIYGLGYRARYAQAQENYEEANFQFDLAKMMGDNYDHTRGTVTPVPRIRGAPAAGVGSQGGSSALAPVVVTGTAGRMQVAGFNNYMPTQRTAVPVRAADELSEMLKRAGYLAGIHTDARRTGESFAEGTSASQNFGSMYDLFTDVQRKLDAGGLDPRAESLLRDIRRTLVNAAPSLGQPVSVVPVELPDNSAAESAFLARFQMGPPPPATPPAAAAPSALQAAFDTFRSTAGALLGRLGSTASGAWGQAKDMGAQQVKSAGQGIVGLMSSFTPLGVVATLLQGVFEGLAPLIEQLKEPLRIVGTILGAALAPVLRILFPIFKIVAIAATYIGQIFFTVAAGIAKAIGSVIKALGTAIDKVPFLGDFGLKKLGQGMIDAGNGFSQSAKELADGREEIKKLKLEDTAQAAQDMTESFQNVPEGFKVALARFEAAAPEPIGGGQGTGGGTGTGGAPAGGTPGTGGGGEEAPGGYPGHPTPGGGYGNPRYPVDEYGSGYGGGGYGQTTHIAQVQIVSNDPERIWSDIQRIAERENARGYGSLVSPV